MFRATRIKTRRGISTTTITAVTSTGTMRTRAGVKDGAVIMTITMTTETIGEEATMKIAGGARIRHPSHDLPLPSAAIEDDRHHQSTAGEDHRHQISADDEAAHLHHTAIAIITAIHALLPSHPVSTLALHHHHQLAASIIVNRFPHEPVGGRHPTSQPRNEQPN